MRKTGTILAMAGLFGLTATAAAQVARFEVTGPPQPAFEGREFGAAGRYERITARATIAVDPVDPRNAVIADIALAPRNAEGRVEAVADVTILRPADPARGNGTLLLEAPNRGRKLALPLFNESSTAASDKDAGNGFLFRHGYTLAWVGWQGDFAPAAGQLGITLPVLAGTTGAVREEVVFDHARSPADIPLAYAAAEPADARMTVRARWDLPQQTPADLAFRFAGPRHVEVDRPAGFDAGALYELTYTARDPMVLGLGFAAVRDTAGFLLRGGGPDNPLAGRVRRGLAFGISQSGRFLRDFLYLGFNEGLDGRPVFDGVMPHVAGARRVFMNTRFARPDKAPRHPQDPAWPADAFPFAYPDATNPFTGARDGLLQRCRASGTCPKVMQTDTEYEWWNSRASLVVTDPAGGPLGQPDAVRTHMIAGTPHFAEPGARTASSQLCALPLNPNHAGAPMRALLGQLEAWVRGEAEPPANRVPDRAEGTLVEAERAWPAAIPGLPYAGLHALAVESDHGSVPPRELGRFTVLVPRADADGMAVAGIRMPVLEAPRATYTGWNPRTADHGGPDVLCPLQGAAVPFAGTRAERDAKGDPRLSLDERYSTPAVYVEAVRASASRLVANRLLLPEDAEAIAEAAEAGNLAR